MELSIRTLANTRIGIGYDLSSGANDKAGRALGDRTVRDGPAIDPGAASVLIEIVRIGIARDHGNERSSRKNGQHELSPPYALSLACHAAIPT